jgi:cyclopropane-fatty-acyl-phospholipid synthase
MRLLDIGCGWGSTLLRAVEKYDVDVVGLTLSDSQKAYCLRKFEQQPHHRRVEIRLQAWEDFDEPVDRIVSIETFEHFRQDQHEAFFARCRSLLPSDGRMLLHAYVRYSPAYLERQGIRLDHEDVLFGKFVCREIFPGRQLVEPETIVARAEAAGFQVAETQALQPHYARTFAIWADNLAAARQEAIAVTSQETFDRFLKYLSGCADCFRRGQADVIQFTLLPK